MSKYFDVIENLENFKKLNMVQVAKQRPPTSGSNPTQPNSNQPPTTFYYSPAPALVRRIRGADQMGWAPSASGASPPPRGGIQNRGRRRGPPAESSVARAPIVSRPVPVAVPAAAQASPQRSNGTKQQGGACHC